MADLFNSNIGLAQGVSANIPGGGLAAPTSVGGVIGDDFSAQQARVNDLVQTNKAKVRAQQSQNLIEAAPKIDQGALEEQKLQQLAVNIQQAYGDIDAKTTNPVEANQKKRQIRAAALIQAGKSGSAYIDNFITSLDTKREVRPDGMVNIIGSKGEVLGIEGGDHRQILEARKERQVNKVHEVFPNTVDTFATLFDINAANGGVMPESVAQETLLRMKNSASAFKGISEDYHIQAQSVDAAGATKLAENAQRAYMGNIANMMNTFMAPDIMNAIKSGTLDRSQVTLAAQQVRRDIIDEITTQHVPVKIGDIDAYIKTTMDDMNAAYNDIQQNDLISIDIANKTLQAKNAIRQHQTEARLGIPEINAVAPMVDMISKLSAASASAAETAANLAYDTSSASKEQQNLLMGQVKAFTNLGTGLQPAIREISQAFTEANYSFTELDKSMNAIQDEATLDSALNSLGRVTAHSVGWVHQPDVQARVDKLVPIADKLLTSGQITQQKYDSIFSQLDQYSEYAKAQITTAGYTQEQYMKEYLANRSLLQKVKDLF